MSGITHPFLGNFNVAIDEKQRVAIPVSMRDTLQKSYAEESDRVTVTLPMVGKSSIAVYPGSVFCALMITLQEQTELDSDAQSLVMTLSASARECLIDKQGRIRLPEDLIEHAGIKRDALFCGHFNRMQIWNAKEWKAFSGEAKASIDERSERTARALNRK